MSFILHQKYFPLIEEHASFKIVYGGRSGGKSWAVAYCLLHLGSIRKRRILCLRQHKINLVDSVYQLFIDHIVKNSAFTDHYGIFNDSIVGANGTTFSFQGVKDATKLKSFEGADIIWGEEASYYSHQSMRILLPTIRKEGSELWFTFNPESEEDAVWQFVKHPRESQLTININYTENPYCSQRTLDEAKLLMETDYAEYLHVYMGELAKSSERIIFKGRWEEQSIKLEKTYVGLSHYDNKRVHVCYGIDFGFHHPTVIIESFEYNGNLYISQEWVKSGADLDDITEAYFREFRFTSYVKIYGDSSDPGSIHTLSKDRYNKHGIHIKGMMIEPANKGQGSVDMGINWLKTHKKIYIDPSCEATIDNFKKYAYKMDRNGDIRDEVDKINDDCIDALRYAHSSSITGVSNKKNIFLSERISRAFDEPAEPPYY